MAHRVHVLPAGTWVEVAEGESLLRAALRAGYAWPTVCLGDGECGTCWVVVESGAEHLSPAGPAEREVLLRGPRAGEPRARLACQTRVEGPVTVRRRAVRPPH